MTIVKNQLTDEVRSKLVHVANSISSAKKGILSLDESIESVQEKFYTGDLQKRREFYRSVIQDEGVAKFVSSVILLPNDYSDQHEGNRETFISTLDEIGIIPGIKLYKEVVPRPGTFQEFRTLGLTDLSTLCYKYGSLGARFAKWRSVFRIQSQVPSSLTYRDNAEELARFASICQSYGLVPLIDVEVIPIGRHCAYTTQRVMEDALSCTFHSLIVHNVLLEGLLLETNFCTPGAPWIRHGGVYNTPTSVANMTLEVLTRRVPSAVPGIFFLNGIHVLDECCRNLEEVIQRSKKIGASTPWNLSFCFGRSIMGPTLSMWQGDAENFDDALVTLRNSLNEVSVALTKH